MVSQLSIENIGNDLDKSKSDDGKQRTEDGGRKTEDGKMLFIIRHLSSVLRHPDLIGVICDGCGVEVGFNGLDFSDPALVPAAGEIGSEPDLDHSPEEDFA